MDYKDFCNGLLEQNLSLWYINELMRNNPRESLLAVHRRHAKAWEQRNLDELRRLYSENAVIFSTEPPPRFADFKTFENTLQQYFSQIAEVSFFTSNIQIEVFENVAWINSQYLRAHRLNGQMVRQSGRWTEVYQKEEDEWKLVHLHSSLDPEVGQ